jgi:hypothetical protein
MHKDLLQDNTVLTARCGLSCCPCSCCCKASLRSEMAYVDVYMCSPGSVYYKLVVCLCRQVPLCRTASKPRQHTWHAHRAGHDMCMGRSQLACSTHAVLQLSDVLVVLLLQLPACVLLACQHKRAVHLRSSPRNSMPISRHVMTVITPAGSRASHTGWVSTSAGGVGGLQPLLHPAGQRAPPDMVFLKKSSLTLGKASRADRVDQTDPWPPPFCAMLAAAGRVDQERVHARSHASCCPAPGPGRLLLVLAWI